MSQNKIKIELEFDKNEREMACNVINMIDIVCDIDQLKQFVLQKLKYEEMPDKCHQILNDIYERICEIPYKIT